MCYICNTENKQLKQTQIMETTNKISIRKAVNCQTLIVFNNETKLKFWKDEMAGQISDGMWENSRNTDWLWRNCLAVVILDGTIPEGVYVSSTYTIGRKTYPWFKQLCWYLVNQFLLFTLAPIVEQCDIFRFQLRI